MDKCVQRVLRFTNAFLASHIWSAKQKKTLKADVELTQFLSFFVLQRGNIWLCGWSSPYLLLLMLPWQSEKSSSWTLASRNRRSSTACGSTDTEMPSVINWTAAEGCKAAVYCGYLLFLTVWIMVIHFCVNSEVIYLKYKNQWFIINTFVFNCFCICSVCFCGAMSIL